MPSDSAHVQALERFADAKSYWSKVLEDAKKDIRYRTGDQWDRGVKDQREADERFPQPALTFNELHTMVQNTTNQARRNRPQPKVGPGDGGTQDTADFLEGRLRHIFYASQADVAWDHATEYAGMCGFGIYRIDKVAVGKSRRMEPRIRRLLDPLKAIYVDTAVVEPDWADAGWWFNIDRLKRDQVKSKYGFDPVPLGDAAPEWGDDKEYVTVAEYWHVENADDEEGRQVVCSFMDGQQIMEDVDWEGSWIPLIPVLCQELVVDGERQLISIIRYSKDPQKLLNAYGSEIAASLGSANDAHYLGAVGQFNHKNWHDNKRHKYYEYDPMPTGSAVIGPPTFNQHEPAIQALSAGWLQMQDQVKRSVGYQDNVLQMSKTPLSGVAVDRREQSQDLINYHLMDNLIRSQLHCARVIIDLDRKWNVVPAILQVRDQGGKTRTVPYATVSEGKVQYVDGRIPGEHIAIDPEEEYHVVIDTGPSYAAKLEEEGDFLLGVIQANPQIASLYLPKIFEMKGYADLAQLAKYAWPPQIQQAESAKEQGIPPAAAQAIQAAQAQSQQLQKIVQTLLEEIKSKSIEGKFKFSTEKLKAIKDIMIQQMKDRHGAAVSMHEGHLAGIEQMLNLLPEPTPPAQPGAPGAPQPQPAGVVQ